MKIIGNKDIMSQLAVAATSAMVENRSLPHTLLSGAAGCGKTSTARYIAERTGCDIIEMPPETIKSRDDMLRVREVLNVIGYDRIGNKIGKIKPSILFIDEIHRLHIRGQEHLGIAMESWIIPVDERQVKLGLTNKESAQFGTNMKGRGRWCPRFTVIGATTDDGLLSKPFKDRFKLKFIFSTYTIDDSAQIVKVHAERLGINITDDAILSIAKRGRGVPRILVSLLERCRDTAVSAKNDIVNINVCKVCFMLMGIDSTGLTQTDIKILKTLYKSEDPVGLDSLSIIVNESKKTISDTIEPYLVQREFILRSSRGRVITKTGREYLIKNGHIEDKDSDNDYIDIPLDYERSI